MVCIFVSGSFFAPHGICEIHPYFWDVCYSFHFIPRRHSIIWISAMSLPIFLLMDTCIVSIWGLFWIKLSWIFLQGLPHFESCAFSAKICFVPQCWEKYGKVMGGCGWCAACVNPSKYVPQTAPLGADLPPTLENECPCKSGALQCSFSVFRSLKESMECLLPFLLYSPPLLSSPLLCKLTLISHWALCYRV